MNKQNLSVIFSIFFFEIISNKKEKKELEIDDIDKKQRLKKNVKKKKYEILEFIFS